MELNIKGIKYPFPKNYLYSHDYEFILKPQIFLDKWELFFSPGDVVLDIGAYIGVISVSLALLGGIVHSFEGSPRNYERLKNICNPLRQIIIHKKALNKDSGKYITKFNDCIAMEHPLQEIEYVCYDDYALKNNIVNPKFVKMDIEGMESTALFGMTNLLNNIRPIWQIEYHIGIKYNYQHYPGFLTPENGGFDFQEFEKLEYSTYDENFNKINIKDMKIYKNYFFIPKEKNIINKIKLI